jgi:hypothetical protein
MAVALMKAQKAVKAQEAVKANHPREVFSSGLIGRRPPVV